MLDAGDEINSESSKFLGFSAQTYLFRLSSWCLEDIQDIKSRTKILSDYINQNPNFSIIDNILIAEDQNREKNHESLLDDSSFEQLKKDFINKLNQSANSNPEKIIQNKSLLSLMYRWKKWGNSSDVLVWFEKQTQDRNGVLKILRTMIQVTRSSNDFYTISNVSKQIKADTVENFLDIPRILNIIDSTDSSVLSDEEKELIEMLKKGIENRTNGRDDD